MEHIQKRSNTWYYYRRIPVSISHLCNMKVMHRSLSKDKALAIKLADRYSNLFNMLTAGFQLGTDVSSYIAELELNQLPTQDIYKQYIDSHEVGEDRLKKIARVMVVVKALLPKELAKIDMALLDRVRNEIIHLPRRSLAKYKNISIMALTGMKIPVNERISPTAVKDYLVILNSFMRYLHEREMVLKPYAVKLIKKATDDREERVALSIDTIESIIRNAKTAKLASSFTLLYLTGLRPSEARLCTISIVAGIKCFDLTDKGISLKTQSSHRLIPVHHSITEPEKMLEDYRSMHPRMISRGFKVEEGTLYSLRHSFATHLASKGIEPYVISELLGHTHKDMTLSRYVKGFPIKLLSEAINKLELVL